MSDVDVKDPPCDGEGLVGDFGPTVRDRELVFAGERITLPGKDGVVAETAQDGVTERQEKNLQHRQCAMSTTNSGHPIIYCKSSFDSIKTNQQIPTWHNSTNQSSDEPEPDSLLSLLVYLFIYNLVCHVYPLNANRLPDIQLPLPLKGVQVPELCRVQGCADGVATWTVDRDWRNCSFMTTHPTDQLLCVWETDDDTTARFTDNGIMWKNRLQKTGLP